MRPVRGNSGAADLEENYSDPIPAVVPENFAAVVRSAGEAGIVGAAAVEKVAWPPVPAVGFSMTGCYRAIPCHTAVGAGDIPVEECKDSAIVSDIGPQKKALVDDRSSIKKTPSFVGS